VATQGGRLPTNEELQPDPNAVQYLEVGLVIGDNPSFYKPTAASGKKDIKAARQLRGEMPRTESASRAFIPVTESILLQSKYTSGPSSPQAASTHASSMGKSSSSTPNSGKVLRKLHSVAPSGQLGIVVEWTMVLEQMINSKVLGEITGSAVGTGL
jgi:hypothetical protein